MFRLVLIATVFVGTYGGALHLLSYKDYSLADPKTDKIIGGEETTIQHIPYIVAIFKIGRHICGGNIIKDDIILTAAHCLQREIPSSFSIRAGSTYKYSGGQVIGLNKYVLHPDYDSYWAHFDVGIMMLSSSIKLGESAGIITMSAQGESVPDGTIARVSGWGKLQFNETETPEALRTVLVPVVNQDVCNAAYGGDISDDMICAGETGKGSCNQDSGGPLVSENENVLVGVVSWGRDCGLATHPKVFARISAVRDWVDTFLK